MHPLATLVCFDAIPIICIMTVLVCPGALLAVLICPGSLGMPHNSLYIYRRVCSGSILIYILLLYWVFSGTLAECLLKVLVSWYALDMSYGYPGVSLDSSDVSYDHLYVSKCGSDISYCHLAVNWHRLNLFLYCFGDSWCIPVF